MDRFEGTAFSAMEGMDGELQPFLAWIYPCDRATGVVSDFIRSDKDWVETSCRISSNDILRLRELSFIPDQWAIARLNLSDIFILKMQLGKIRMTIFQKHGILDYLCVIVLTLPVLSQQAIFLST
jgi:hypothetical protein